MKINYEKVVELSHKMIPNTEFFTLETDVYDVTTKMPNVKHRDDIWYVLSDIKFNSHISTHIEFPFHHWKQGADALNYPLQNMIGECVALDFTNKNPGECITLEELKKYDDRIKIGDIVLIKTGMDKYFKTENWELQPHIAADAMEWLINEKKPKIIGTDASGFEVPGTDYQPNHLKMFQNGIAMIESATNLAALGDDRATCFILPLAIQGIDSCPVRIVAIKTGGFINE
jgi:arylformamidase